MSQLSSGQKLGPIDVDFHPLFGVSGSKQGIITIVSACPHTCSLLQRLVLAEPFLYYFPVGPLEARDDHGYPRRPQFTPELEGGRCIGAHLETLAVHLSVPLF